MILAHIFGLPLEESLLPLASSMMPAMLVGFAVVSSRVRTGKH